MVERGPEKAGVGSPILSLGINEQTAYGIPKGDVSRSCIEYACQRLRIYPIATRKFH